MVRYRVKQGGKAPYDVKCGDGKFRTFTHEGIELDDELINETILRNPSLEKIPEPKVVVVEQEEEKEDSTIDPPNVELEKKPKPTRKRIATEQEE